MFIMAEIPNRDFNPFCYIYGDGEMIAKTVKRTPPKNK
ncbi:hypothetical protein JCM19301_3175 [Jejuia pallidilutea]|uniref:Uncharacterized protein n=1 Tax=Jejuia pallidilutea TaxID=504487 RepID=A0A090WRD1_9FLAO|nr:hypothetical protein JCM19301_3175 [Jejuia pallidilutea]GAL69957.1 hypothetical protein JCM19302_852 [Jejuia pallidilutea]GAL90965.1 hypothetical protein JCM19538_1023 [Jejuia pallidilutea]